VAWKTSSECSGPSWGWTGPANSIDLAIVNYNPCSIAISLYPLSPAVGWA
jgi:hypothetical protein